MMTIASIDTVTESMAPEASQTVPEVGVSAESVGAFQQALYRQVAENENLGIALREAMVSVSTVLAQVEPTVAPTVAASVSPVVVQPLPMLVTENAALGQTLQAEKVIVENLLPKIEIKIVTKVVEQPAAAPTLTPDPSVVSAPLAAPVVVQPLPAQVTENVKLGEALAAATVVVGETLAKVETVVVPIAVEQPVATPTDPSTIAPMVAPTELSADATPHVSLVLQAPQVPQLTPDSSVVSTPLATPVLVPLPAQVTENVKLGETLAAATVVVGETLAKVDVAAMGGTRFVASADGTEAVSLAVQSSVRDPEASAEALVAAGVTPQAPVQVPAAVEAPQTAPAVAPVDVVRVQAATAAEAVPSQVLVQAAEAVADTLLVSPGLLRGQGEVLVRLRPDVLDGTEVKISVTGRQLDVVFQPQTVDMAVMIENCRTQLVQYLANKIVSFNVTVDVRKRRVEG